MSAAYLNSICHWFRVELPVAIMRVGFVGAPASSSRPAFRALHSRKNRPDDEANCIQKRQN
jgi:hypothetical protein